LERELTPPAFSGGKRELGFRLFHHGWLANDPPQLDCDPVQHRALSFIRFE
jgi:hypothetical protein